MASAHPWTDEERAQLREYYPTMGARLMKEAGMLPGRSVKAIIRYATHVMGLTMTPEARRAIAPKSLFTRAHWVDRTPEEIEVETAKIRETWDDARWAQQGALPWE